MQKYLPNNVKINPSAQISVIYEFSTNKDGDEKLEFFVPIELTSLSKRAYQYRQVGNLRFFDDKGHKLEFSAICEAERNKGHLFHVHNVNLGDLRKECAKELKLNLENQINRRYEKGDFNVFK